MFSFLCIMTFIQQPEETTGFHHNHYHPIF